jgi:hypothetical protein
MIKEVPLIYRPPPLWGALLSEMVPPVMVKVVVRSAYTPPPLITAVLAEIVPPLMVNVLPPWIFTPGTVFGIGGNNAARLTLHSRDRPLGNHRSSPFPYPRPYKVLARRYVKIVVTFGSYFYRVKVDACFLAGLPAGSPDLFDEILS